MKRVVSYLLLCVLCLTGLGSVFAASPETDSSDWPDAPFARNNITGEIICLGMDKDEAEAITGAMSEEFMGMYAYEGCILGFRDDRVVYIRLSIYEEPIWVANGVVTPGMPTDQVLEALEMPFEAGNGPYELLYFEDGSREHRNRNTLWLGRDDYQWALSISGNSETIMRIEMGDKQFLQTYK